MTIHPHHNQNSHHQHRYHHTASQKPTPQLLHDHSFSCLCANPEHALWPPRTSSSDSPEQTQQLRRPRPPRAPPHGRNPLLLERRWTRVETTMLKRRVWRDRSATGEQTMSRSRGGSLDAGAATAAHIVHATEHSKGRLGVPPWLDRGRGRSWLRHCERECDPQFSFVFR